MAMHSSCDELVNTTFKVRKKQEMINGMNVGGEMNQFYQFLCAVLVFGGLM